jgi:LDH2 family malate/lactate/ureidoglycolate dehydrogenase
MQAFYDDVEKLVGQLKSSPLAEGSPGIFLPGEIEDNKAADAEKNGLPISDDLKRQLAALAADLGIAAPHYLGADARGGAAELAQGAAS